MSIECPAVDTQAGAAKASSGSVCGVLTGALDSGEEQMDAPGQTLPHAFRAPISTGYIST